MEARVCSRLTRECAETGDVLLQQVRFPLTSLAPKESGRAHTICVDFLIVPKAFRVVDAKSPTRISRDWRLRTAAFESAYGKSVEECAE
jgi:hypothetical protein